MVDLPRLIFLSGFLPSLRVPSGGQNLVGRVLREACLRQPVSLVTFCNRQEKPYFDPAEFVACRESNVFELTTSARLFASFCHPRLPLISSARFHEARGVVQRLLRQPASEVWVEFIQAASLLDLVPRTTPTTLVVHDLFHQALERRSAAARGWKRSLLQIEAGRTRAWEARILKRPDRLVCINDKDRDLIATFAGRRDVEVRYPVVDERYRTVRRSSDRIRPGMVLFWGLMSRAENEDAALWFVREVLPQIRRDRPGVRFCIAGASPSESVRSLAGPNVEVLGFVQDPVALFESAEVAVAPLRLGSGIKIKVVEFLAAGLPTVATSVGAEGVRPSELLMVADSAEHFARACLARMMVPVRE
jgi:glycosyltransferase involved in cell wall biosynthesis